MKNKKRNIFFLLSALLIAAILLSVSLGAVSMSVGQVVAILLKSVGVKSSILFSENQENVLWTLRLPRIGFAVMIGAALATSGVALQGLFRNPLVDSGLIGIASGSSLFASCFILFNGLVPALVIGTSQLTMAITSFIGASLTAFLVYRISQYQKRINIAVLILAGVALNALTASLTGLLTYFADDSQLRDLTFWTLGSLAGATWENLAILTPFILLPIFVLQRSAKALNAFSLGENPAHFLGINIRRTKITVLLCSTAMVGASVAFAGVIAFVGLVIPHIMRMLVGPGHRALLPVSAIAGATLLCFADLLSRTLLPPTEIPVGIITALMGTPVLIAILLKQKKNLFS